MSGPGTTVIVHACLRDGTGGSPTAVVLDDDRLSDEQRRRVPLDHGTSHAVFLQRRPEREPTVDQPAIHIRFFTSSGELPACGHGTVAALAFLASRAEDAGDYRALLRTSTRTFEGRALREGAYLTAAFDPGPVDLRQASAEELSLALPALGITAADPAQDVRVAGVGRKRLLIPVNDRAALASLDPNSGRLREVCDHLGLLGAYVYSPPSPTGALAARMFAPSIGVPEDLANANSTASSHPTPSGPRVHVGGTATIGPPLPRA
ncbi:PhzF family phenazine biosynthesis protein [Streptomyces sp. NPDC059708]|uniref:PhzF family phenazine biosynthesis protein n=1 Tax=Streptomyces sp. NPDC059708 TaxID=3346916 RepID=UPI0036BF34B9